MHGKYVSIVGAHFGSHWAKRGADADRKSLGKFGPAFVSDPIVFGHIEASQVLVDLQEIDRKSMVSGVLTRLKTHQRFLQAVEACECQFSGCKAAEKSKAYLQSFCEVYCAGIANVVFR